MVFFQYFKHNFKNFFEVICLRYYIINSLRTHKVFRKYSISIRKVIESLVEKLFTSQKNSTLFLLKVYKSFQV